MGKKKAKACTTFNRRPTKKTGDNVKPGRHDTRGWCEVREVRARDVGETHTGGGEKPTVRAIGLQRGIGVKEVDTRKRLNI